MADDLRIYFFSCGSLKTYTQYIKMNMGMGEEYEVPVPFFLITHPRGNVLFDGGNALETAQDAVGHWGEGVVEIYEPVMTEDDFVVNQLQAKRTYTHPYSAKPGKGCYSLRAWHKGPFLSPSCWRRAFRGGCPPMPAT